MYFIAYYMAYTNTAHENKEDFSGHRDARENPIQTWDKERGA